MRFGAVGADGKALIDKLIATHEVLLRDVILLFEDGSEAALTLSLDGEAFGEDRLLNNVSVVEEHDKEFVSFEGGGTEGC